MDFFRAAIEKKDTSEMSLEEAKELVISCVRMCFYRDCRASPRYNLAVISDEGALVEEPKVVESNWDMAHMISGFE